MARRKFYPNAILGHLTHDEVHELVDSALELMDHETLHRVVHRVAGRIAAEWIVSGDYRKETRVLNHAKEMIINELKETMKGGD